MKEQVIDDDRKKLLVSFLTKKVKNERQVDAGSLVEKYGVLIIRPQGLSQWFNSLLGYNLKCGR